MNADLKLIQQAKAAGIAAGEPFPTTIDRSKGDGDTTCLLHRCHEWSLKFYAPLMPLCTICGGRCAPGQIDHPLCVQRKKFSLTIKQLDSFSKCSCARCSS